MATAAAPGRECPAAAVSWRGPPSSTCAAPISFCEAARQPVPAVRADPDHKHDSRRRPVIRRVGARRIAGHADEGTQQRRQPWPADHRPTGDAVRRDPSASVPPGGCAIIEPDGRDGIRWVAAQRSRDDRAGQRRIRSGPATVTTAVRCRRGSQDVPTVPCPPRRSRQRLHHQSRAWTPARGERRPPAPMRTYPFTAVVGSDDMALALVLTTDLARGRRRARPRREGHREVDDGAGAGRRAAADRRSSTATGSPATRRDPDPPRPDGPYAADAAAAPRPARLVELPVGATEDRVLGSLHLERACPTGVTEYEPGLLAARPPRHPVRRRGQPAARPPGRPAAGRRRHGPLDGRARRASRSRTPPASCWSAR